MVFVLQRWVKGCCEVWPIEWWRKVQSLWYLSIFYRTIPISLAFSEKMRQSDWLGRGSGISDLCFFKDYKPEVPSHNSFESQLCVTLKNAHAICKEKARSSRCCGLSFTQKTSRCFFFLSRRAMVILKVWHVCQIICIAGDVQRQNKLWARHLIASGSLIRVIIVNDTFPLDFSVKFLWLGWKLPHFFPENS